MRLSVKSSPCKPKAWPQAILRRIFAIYTSDSTISRIMDKILPIAKEWQARPLESIYTVIYAIHYHVRQDGRIIKKAVYIAIGINIEGIKDVLGLWIGENESSKYWLSVINEIKNRGVKDVLIACVDGLSGFSEAISAVFPDTEIQKCVMRLAWSVCIPPYSLRHRSMSGRLLLYFW